MGLLAPFTPFLAEELYQNLVRSVSPHAPESVHLTAYPQVDESVRDDALRRSMAVARQLVTLGRDARGAAGVAMRQPLRRAVVTGAGELSEEIRDVVASELNVKELTCATDDAADMVTLRADPSFRALGPQFGKRTPAVAEAIRRADARAMVEDLRGQGRFVVDVDGEPVEISGEQVRIVEQPVTGWQMSSAGTHSVAIDLSIDEGLRLEGLAREFVRLVKDLRRRHGLRVEDRVDVDVLLADDPGGQVGTMLGRHGEAVATELRADTLTVPVTAANAEAAELRVGDARLLVDFRVKEPHGAAPD
jgi:isoleucyl-tRNA synthetase